MFVVSLFTSFLYLIRHYGIAFRYLRFEILCILGRILFDPNEVKNEKPETAPWTLDETRGNLKIFSRPADEWGNPDVLYMLKTDVKMIFFESVRDNVFPK